MKVTEGRIELLALDVARGRTVTEGARSLGLSTRTGFRIADEPEFKAKVDGFRRAMIAEAVGRLADSVGLAVETLVELLGTAHPPTVRLGAARGILADLISFQSHAEMSRRLDMIEEIVRGKP